MPVDTSRCFDSQLSGNVTVQNCEHMSRIERIRSIESELADRGMYTCSRLVGRCSLSLSLPSPFFRFSPSTSHPPFYPASLRGCRCLFRIHACAYTRTRWYTGGACARLQEAQQIVQTVLDEVLAGKWMEDEKQDVTRKGEKALALVKQTELASKEFRRLKALEADYDKLIQKSRAQDEEFRNAAHKHGDLVQMHADIDSLLAEALTKCGKVCKKRGEDEDVKQC